VYQLGIADQIARHIRDRRSQLLIMHTFADMVLERKVMIRRGMKIATTSTC
jgi:hypothetical protein